MLPHFNFLHRFLFQKSFSKIQISQEDIQKIHQAAKKGPLVYVMKNWGQIEYNYFNHLFLKETLPLADWSNLLKMKLWMPWNFLLKHLFLKLEKSSPKTNFLALLKELFEKKKSIFFVLNQTAGLQHVQQIKKQFIGPLFEALNSLPSDETIHIVPLNLIFDSRPGRVQKTWLDLLFGPKENPGTIRKIGLFFKNAKKRAVAQVLEPINLKQYVSNRKDLNSEKIHEELASQLDSIFYKESQKITGSRLKSREQMVEEILSNRSLREKLLRLSETQKCSLDSLYLEAEEILYQIVADPNYHFIDFWDLTLKWVFKNIYEELVVDLEGLAKVKKLAKDYPLILVPAHRSHIDYLLLSYIFYNHQLSIPLIAAGENLNFWPMGYIFRKSGAYFIRRSFGEDALYPLLFKSYAKHLIEDSFFQEFFIEGTRSRSGKLEKPKTGLLSLFIESFIEKPQKDLYFVPIAISYERVLETHSYTQESLGSEKKEEGVWDILKASKHLKNKSGKVYVQFGEALSLKNAISNIPTFQSSETFKSAVKEFSLQIATAINQKTLITAHSVCGAVLLASEKISEIQLIENSQLLIALLEKIGSPLSLTLKQEREKACQEVIRVFIQQGYVQGSFEGERIYQVKRECRPHLNYFKNGMIHSVSDLSLLALSLNFFRSDKQINLSLVAQAYDVWAQNFSEEFIEISPFDCVLQKAVSLKLIHLHQSEIEVLDWRGVDLLFSFVQALMIGQKMILEFLIQHPFVGMRERKLIVKIMRFMQHCLTQKGMVYSEALSRYSVQNTLESFRKIKLIKSHELELGKRGRKVFSSLASLEELKEFQAKLWF